MTKRGVHILTTVQSIALAMLTLLMCVACSDNSNIDSTQASTPTSHDDAYLALLRSEEIYLNSDTPSYTDQDIALMESYYLTSDIHEERAHALFFAAQHNYDNGNTAEALLRLIEAEKSTQHNGDRLYEGRIRRMMGDIYGQEYLFNNALNEYALSK
jgi:hypothetical protein